MPRIFNLVLIEPGKSFVRVIQSIGRGIRKAEDKERALTRTKEFIRSGLRYALEDMLQFNACRVCRNLMLADYLV